MASPLKQFSCRTAARTRLSLSARSREAPASSSSSAPLFSMAVRSCSYSSNTDTTPRYDSIPREDPKWAKFPDGSRFWKEKNGRLQRPIFVAATRQHVGVSVASYLQAVSRVPRVAALVKDHRTNSDLKKKSSPHVSFFAENDLLLGHHERADQAL